MRILAFVYFIVSIYLSTILHDYIFSAAAIVIGNIFIAAASIKDEIREHLK